MLALFGAFGGLLLCISLYGQLGEGWSPIHAGLTLTPMIVGMVIGMVVSGALVQQLGRHLLHIGIALVTIGTAAIAVVLTGAHSASSWDLVPGLVLVGAGLGATFGQLFMFILTSVNSDEVGSASGVLEATQQLSTSLGVAVLGNDLLLRSPPPPATRRAPNHRMDLPRPAGRGVPPGLQPANERARGGSVAGALHPKRSSGPAFTQTSGPAADLRSALPCARIPGQSHRLCAR